MSQNSSTPPWRLLVRHVRPHRAAIGAALALGLLATATELVAPLVTRSVLASLDGGASLAGPMTLLVSVLVVGTLLGYVQNVLLGSVAERVILSARRGMLDRLVHARVDALGARSGGEMVSRVTSDTTLIREASTTSLVYLVSGGVSLVGSLALMAYLDLVLLAATALVVVVGGALALLLMPSLARVQRDVQEQLGRLGGRLEGVVRANRTVKAARAEGRELERLDATVTEAGRLGVRAVRLEAAADTLTGLAVNVVVLVVLGLGAARVASGAMDVPTLVAYLLYVFGLTAPVMMLTMSITSLQAGLAAVVRIDEVTSLPQETDGPRAPRPADPGSNPGPNPAPTAGPVIAARGVRFGYGDGRVALDGLDLVVPRRGHTAIVGPSGAGKSTVFSLLLKFATPDAGDLELEGAPYASWSAAEVRSRIGYVEQDTPLVPGTVRDNVALGTPDAADDVVWEALRAVRLDARVAALAGGLDADVASTTLSGGERQRLAIARALLVRPRVLLLDEATAQLDALTEAAVADGIRELARHGAVVSIAHRLSTVMDADQIVVLEDGRTRATGTHGSLVATDELYAELVAALRIHPTPVVV